MQSLVKRSGAYALKAAVTTSNTCYVEYGGYDAGGSARSVPINSRQCFVGVAFRFAALPASGKEPFLEWRANSARKGAIALNASGNLELIRAAGNVVATGATVLAPNTWYYVEGVLSAFSTGYIECRLNGVLEASGNGDVRNENSEYVRIGKPYNANSNTVEFYFDDFIINDAAYANPCRIYRLAPVADGATQQFSAGTNASNYLECDEAPADDDTTYVQAPTDSVSAQFEIASAAALVAESEEIYALASVAYLKTGTNVFIQLREGGVVAGTSLPISGGVSYRELSYVAPFRVSTGERWTVETVAGAEVGVFAGSGGVGCRLSAMFAHLVVRDKPAYGDGVQAEVGSFALGGAAGNREVSLSFPPKLLLVYGGHNTADSILGEWRYFLNAFASADGRNFQLSDTRRDANTTSQVGNVFLNGGGTLFTRKYDDGTDFIGILAATEDNKVRFGVELPGATNNAHYLALGGEQTEVDIVWFTSNSSAGNQVVPCRFDPDLVLFVLGVTGGDAVECLGAADATNQWASCTFSRDNQADSDNKTYQKTNRCILRMGTSVQLEASFVSLGTRQFTINIENSPSTGYSVAAICIKGPQVAVGSLTQPVATGEQTVTGLGFAPGALLCCTGGGVASASVVDVGRKVLGAATAAAQKAIACAGQDNAAVTVEDSYWASDKLLPILEPGAPAVLASVAGLSSLDGDGFTLDWSTADGTQREVLYVALGATLPEVSGSLSLLGVG